MLKHALAIMVGYCLNSSVMAFEEITEEELSILSAQDGISLLWKMPDKGVRMDAVALIDKNGIADNLPVVSGYNNAGKIIARNVGIKTCSESSINGSCTALVMPTLRFDSDVMGDHNNNGIGSPSLNIAVSLMGGANKIRFYLDKIALSNNAGTNEKTLIDFGGRTGGDVDADGDYIDILPNPAKGKTLFNVQLGFEPQDSMIKFINGDFGTIDFGTVSIVEGTNTANSLRFGLKLEQFDMTGLGVDIGVGGLVFSHANFGGSVMDITMSDIKMGGSTAASMGTIGLQNVNVTDLMVTIAGKN